MESIDDKKLKERLTDEEYSILRQKGTEAPFSGELLNNKEHGMYSCKVCGVELFSSDAKFDSGTGWPSFDKALNIELKEDTSHGMNRTEVICKNCGSHLGHVFADGPTETGERYCINSACLNFNKKDDSQNK